MVIKIQTPEDRPLVVETDDVRAVSIHRETNGHNNCGSVFMRGMNGQVFHVADPIGLQERLVPTASTEALFEAARPNHEPLLTAREDAIAAEWFKAGRESR